MSASGLKLVKTCQNCARAKIRCLRTAGVASCDRCSRLNKECVFRPTRSRNNPAKKDIRIEALEAKVEQLIAQSGSHLQRSQSTLHSPITPDSDHPSHGDHLSDESPHDVIGRGIISFEEASFLLGKFRANLMPYFPFVILAPEMNLSRMRKEKPVLLIAVLMVSADPGPQKVLHDAFKEAIAERMIFSNSQSLDVLQGLLVTQAWSQHRSDWLSCSAKLHLALSIICDLQFDRLSDVGVVCSRITMNESIARPEGSPVSLTNEKKRAVIGCLMLLSCLSTILQKTHAKSRQPFVERYARELAQDPEYPSDAWLVHVVRIQHIMERVDEAVAATDPSDTDTVVRAFYSEIDAYKTRLPPSANSNIIVQIYLYSLELFVCQAFLFDTKRSTPFPILSSKPQTLNAGQLHQHSSHSDLNFKKYQIELLRRGLIAAKDALDLFLDLNTDVDRCVNYMQWLQSGSNVVLACKLAVIASNYASRNPHIQSLCNTLDMPKILRCMLQRLDVLGENQDQVEGKPSTRSFYVQWIQRIHTWFEQRYHAGHLEAPSRIPGDLADGHGASAPYPRTALSWDATPLDGQFHGDLPRHDVGAWPDFVWNVTMEDILNGPMDFMSMPLDMNEGWM